jgi:EAL domain-containing protein (putative c-di-GMP-specific phosphodiesterase class I)
MTSIATLEPKVLVADDEDTLRRHYERTLSAAGFAVHSVPDGSSALRALADTSFDVIVSDIGMPGMNGLELLQRVRAHDLDVPVVLVTGAPSIETAVHAVEHGALRYLVKPVESQLLVKVVADAVRLHRIAKAKRQALDLAGGVDHFVGDRAGLITCFGRALASFHVAYQPIISWATKSVFAYEALLRSREPTLPNPGAMLDAAERLDRVHELGRSIRARALEPLGMAGDDVLLFLNLHPTDLLDAQLFSADSPLSAAAHRVVLEITERASLEGMPDVRARVALLREMGFRIAIDDLGAGYAGLSSFALLEPDIVKLDMSLVRNLHREPTKKTLVRTMVKMCKDLGMLVTAEGIEEREELAEVQAAGCDLLQGYLFARPGPPFPTPVF